MNDFNNTPNGKRFSKLAALGFFLVLFNNIAIGFLSITGYGGDIKKLILYFVTHMLSAAGAVLIGVYTGALVQYKSKKKVDIEE